MRTKFSCKSYIKLSDNNYKINKERAYMLIDIVLVYAVGRGGLENVISKV